MSGAKKKFIGFLNSIFLDSDIKMRDNDNNMA